MNRILPMLVLPADFTPASLPCTVSDGAACSCVLRRLTPSDAALLLKFFRSHTQETRLRRYGYAKFEMSMEQALAMVAVDQTKDAALALTEQTATAERIVAVGRYSRDAEGQGAEMAFVVHEKRRKLGMATLLLGALRVIAAGQGIRSLHALTQQDNYAMLGIFFRAGAQVNTLPGTDSVEILLEIPEPVRRRGKRGA